MDKTFLENDFPKDSADLYRRSEYFTQLFGDDVFFVTVNHSSSENTPPITGDQALSLSDKVAYNPAPPKAKFPLQEMARAAFAEYRAAHPDRFPTMAEVRNQTGHGEGVQLVSGGAFLFVAAAGEEIKLALFQRTGGAARGLWTDANGLVAGPNTAEKEAAEEYTPIENSPTGLIVHGVQFPDGILADDCGAIKRDQRYVIAENLARAGVEGSVEDLRYRASPVESILPMQENSLTLIDGNGEVVDRLAGVIGFEREYNTWIYRRFGLLNTENPIMLVDGEPFNRPGRLVTKAEFAELADQGVLLGSTASIGGALLPNWPAAPRIGMSSAAKPAIQTPSR